MLGEAWITGVLAGIEDAAGIDLRRCEHFVGTSAWSIVAARLAAGQSPRRPTHALAEAQKKAIARSGSRAGQLVRVAGDWAIALSSPVASLSLAATAPGGALARAVALQAIPRGSVSLDGLRQEIDRAGASFDGRLRVTAVNRATGRRVVFGRPSSPKASVAEAVEASCTVPWLFAPVRIGEVEYVDGGVWSPTNLDAAPAGRGTHVLCLNPTAGLAGRGRMVTLARRASRTLMTIEAGILRRRGAVVALAVPDTDSAEALGEDLMEPGRRGPALEAGYRQGQRLAERDG